MQKDHVFPVFPISHGPCPSPDPVASTRLQARWGFEVSGADLRGEVFNSPGAHEFPTQL